MPTPDGLLAAWEARKESRDDPVFEHLFIDLECRLSPNTVLLYPEKKAAAKKRRDMGHPAARGQTRRRMLR